MSAAGRLVALTAAALAALATSGCGNFYVGVTEQPWRIAGANEPPASTLRDFVVTTLAPGNGPVVRPGDLVYARVMVTTAREQDAALPVKSLPVNVWLWTGSHADAEGVGAQTWGDLGSARVRRALIGRTVGERFTIHSSEDAEGAADALPQFVFAMPFDSEAAVRWPTVHLSGVGPISAEIEILDSCNARLSRREATLTQRGYVFAMFDRSYAPVRRGRLGWSALESDCVAFGRNVRFEVGPLYAMSPGPSGGGALHLFSESYAVASALTLGGADLRYVVAMLAGYVGFRIGRWRRLRGRIGTPFGP